MWKEACVKIRAPCNSLDRNIIPRRDIMRFDFIDYYNVAVGAAVAVLTAIFGVYWYLFAGYLLLNVLDWITGWRRANKLHQESSMVGLRGIVKKTGYWIIVLIAFMIPDLFIKLGRDTLGINLDFLMLLGWFTLATLIVNEIRSILENLVEMNYDVPEILISGLAITEKLIKKKSETIIPEDEGGKDNG